jgi:hypothetical protein
LVLHKFYEGYDLARLLIQALDRRHCSDLVSDYLSFFLGFQKVNS